MPSARGGPACCPAAVAYQARPPDRVMGAKIKVGAMARLPGSAVPCACGSAVFSRRQGSGRVRLPLEVGPSSALIPAGPPVLVPVHTGLGAGTLGLRGEGERAVAGVLSLKLCLQRGSPWAPLECKSHPSH